MKRTFIVFTCLLAAMNIAMSCASKKELAENSKSVPMLIAKGYHPITDAYTFCKKIATEKDFNSYFDRNFDATPDPIDFEKQFVVAVIAPTTDKNIVLNPIKPHINDTQDSLVVMYSIGYDSKIKSYTHSPHVIFVFDKKYENLGVTNTLLWSTGYYDSSIWTNYLKEWRKRIKE